MLKNFVVLILTLCLLPIPAAAQEASDSAESLDAAIAGLQLRGLGPALMGGRIADLAIDPRDANRWYVAVGSGGLWRTDNAGTTWTPIFDDQASYSIGDVALDPSRPDVVWVGTGENVSGRHVAWGDGVYKSVDRGKTWTSMGLEKSEHIGKILVDPRDGDVVYVAAEGPLWTSGGERGLFKTTDGGETWTPVLQIDEDTGVTAVEFDPRNPDVLYAATYERRRKVWAHLAGGDGSGIHKSSDGGETWTRLTTGLPSGDMGKIGLAVSPANPDVVYATIEAHSDQRGFYRSLDAGGSWEKRNSYISNGTGPHYYQEIYASPHDVDVAYQMDVFLHVTRDGGKTFSVLGDGRQKHSDNHAFWIDPKNPKHLLAGTDAGLYETFDDGASWRHFPNMPISQFYKLALDNSSPFYNILGGAQDLGTLHGPSRTTTTDGVRNRDWYVPLGADGYACAFDTENPDIAYMEWQVGSLVRWDRKTGENIGIKPQPEPGDPVERWNWDSPLIVSPHAAGRLYFGSQRVWKSDDRGDSWTPISEDLTRGTPRYEMAIGGRVRSVDALYDNGAMSQYATLTAIDESPLAEGLLYAGSDDGLVSVYEDGAWRQAAAFPSVHERAFVNEITVSQHDADTVFVALDAHKEGDYRPYIFRSDDRGKSWRNVAGDLPESTIIWSIAQDHEVADLLFAGAEHGLFASLDGGVHWTKLSGAPTISFRDLAIQRRDDDLVGATFGRGFYVLDDYSPLRELAAGGGADALFPVRDAWWYVPEQQAQAVGQPTQGSTAWRAQNPPFGAVFSFHLKESPESLKETRREGEKKIAEKDEDVPFAGWDRLADEADEAGSKIFLLVRDADGEPVRRLEAPASAGLHRVAWDLRRPAPDRVDLSTPSFRPPWAGDAKGPLAPPGVYSVEATLYAGGEMRPLGEAQTFEVKAVPGASLPTPDFDDVAQFQERTAELMRRLEGAGEALGDARERVRYLRRALRDAPRADGELFVRLDEVETHLKRIGRRLFYDEIRGGKDEPQSPTVSRRIGEVSGGHWDTRQAPTKTHRRSVEIAESEMKREFAELKSALADLERLEQEAESAGAPWTPGRSFGAE